MKRFAAAVCLLPLALLGPATVSGQDLATLTGGLPPAGGGGGGYNYTAVRAEYVDLSGNRDEVDTSCYLINKSSSQLIVLHDVLVVGEGGTQQVLGLDTSHRGQVLRPLGSVELPIDSTIPGVKPETEIGQKGVASVIVSWAGPAGALELSAVIHLEQPGNLDNRTRFEVKGYDLVP